mmetsp:Transcript_20397/g.37087  ORF Transcript_20397/g.37087 Transcript_20397/m.37087 type:complete len:137 (-) Transcript_20397:70-480(-)
MRLIAVALCSLRLAVLCSSSQPSALAAAAIPTAPALLRLHSAVRQTPTDSRAEASQRAQEAEHQEVVQAVELSDSLKPDVSVVFEPEPPDETGGVWDFETEEATFASPTDSDPLIMPVGFLSKERHMSLDLLDPVN